MPFPKSTAPNFHGISFRNIRLLWIENADSYRLLHLEQEPRGNLEPPAWWPSYTGDIVFDNVTIRYSQHLDPALSDISVRIPGGSTTALLGRTGDLVQP